MNIYKIRERLIKKVPHLKKMEKTIKILNAYAGKGGNRELWPEYVEIKGEFYKIQVVAIENNHKVADMYRQKFPNDLVIETDAHQYILEHYQEFYFIWSSPPCQSHSVTNWFLQSQGVRRYPDMRLWQEVIFLKNFCKKKPIWVVENVKSYYEPFIYAYEIGRHFVWCNFIPASIKTEKIDIGRLNGTTEQRKKNRKGNQFDRNMVNPKIGLHLFNCAFNNIQKKVGDFEK